MRATTQPLKPLAALGFSRFGERWDFVSSLLGLAVRLKESCRSNRWPQAATGHTREETSEAQALNRCPARVRDQARPPPRPGFFVSRPRWGLTLRHGWNPLPEEANFGSLVGPGRISKWIRHATFRREDPNGLS